MKRKVIITAALSGGGRITKEHNPYLPETPQEIAEASYKCWQAGASIVHVHARNEMGRVTADPEVYKETHQLIRDKCDIIFQVSTGLGPHVALEDRVKVIESQPEMCSLNMGSLIRVGVDDECFFNTPSQIETYAKRMLELGIKPELEVFNNSMFRDVDNLITQGLVKQPYFINLVFGMSYQGVAEASSKNLIQMIDLLPENIMFNVSAIGRHQLHLTTIGLLMGGNVRVGLEDNIYYDKGILASNEMLVERAARLINELQFEVATPKESRDMLGIPQLDS